ncbi:MAG: hypothetical protein Q9213_002566 [Squamulea squamosa]
MSDSGMGGNDVVLVAPPSISEQTTTMLTPLDNIMPRVYSRIILAFGPFESCTPAMRNHFKTHLMLALEPTIDKIPILAGKVSPVKGGSGRLCVVPGDGVRLYFKDLSREASWSYHDLEQHRFPMASMDGNTIAPTDSISAEAEPAVAIAQINFLDHGALLTLCVHHAVMDIAGVATVLRTWAQNVATAPNPANLSSSAISLDRTTLLLSTDFPTSVSVDQFAQYRIAVAPSPASEVKTDTAAPPLPSMTAQVFYFTPTSLTGLKVMAQPTQPSSSFISTNDALSAFLWYSITKVRFSGIPQQATSDTSALGFAVDGRKRLDPPLPSGYVGNVNIYAYASLAMSTLRSSDSAAALPTIAAAIRSSITALTDKRIREVIQFIDSVPCVTDIFPGFNSFLGPDLAITSWSNTGIEDLDWGILGQVQAVRIPNVSFDGLCIVLPTRGEGLDVIIGLEIGAMGRLCSDNQWKEMCEPLG